MVPTHRKNFVHFNVIPKITKGADKTDPSDSTYSEKKFHFELGYVFADTYFGELDKLDASGSPFYLAARTNG